MPKIAFFLTGTEVDKVTELIPFRKKEIPICKVPKINLMKYDILIIPSGTNKHILNNIQKRLEKFVSHGGFIVSLGGSYLSYCTYNKFHLNDIEPINNSIESSALFDGLTEIDHYRFQRDFITHGYFTCNEAICQPLIVGKEHNDLVLAIINPDKSTGKLLITTLDPDFHAVSGHAMGGVEYNKYAKKLFENIISWAVIQSRKQNWLPKIGRRLIGISQITLITSFLFTSISLCFLSILLYYLGKISIQKLTFIGTLSSIISLGLTLLMTRNK